jgi:2-keto-4-pentenoate hydratase/2-oxohepta-3-ene-1,7-dioic acid hydratase in catechol pathway
LSADREITMRLVTFIDSAGRACPGLLEGDCVVNLSDIAGSVRELIENQSLIQGAPRGAWRHALSAIRLLAPLPRPARNVFCVGKNYREHAKEFAGSGFDSSAGAKAQAVPELPIIFSKPPTSVSAPGDPIDTSLDPANSVDYEAELAVVVGKGGRVAPGDDPMDFVFGYTLVNDVTSRELQKLHKQWLLGKGIDGFCPMGPVIVTKDELPNIEQAVLSCHVNGELRQRAPIADLIFDVPTLIRTIGRSITLEPGDVIATGTPAGVGIGFSPPRYLRPRDVVRIELEGIGVLENPVI